MIGISLPLTRRLLRNTGLSLMDLGVESATERTPLSQTAYAVVVKIGGRDVGTVAKALVERRHYHAAVNMVRLYK
ncbi:hypothetical protein ACQKHK_12535, partial [Staphylococcus capitis]|uniref:hypothetical protein n=1 Tax=Staphylococcus capitis TaxID=29388 RepID=UPI003D0348A9